MASQTTTDVMLERKSTGLKGKDVILEYYNVSLYHPAVLSSALRVLAQTGITAVKQCRCWMSWHILLLQRYNNGDVDGVMELMDPGAQCEHPLNCFMSAGMS